MAGTFTQIYFHAVFAVKGRSNFLQKPWRDEVFKYKAGIIKNKGHKPIIVNGVADHAHLFWGLKPSMAISELIRDVKNNTSSFIIGKEHFEKSTWSFSRNFRFLLKIAFCSNGWSDDISPLRGLELRLLKSSYNHCIPSGFGIVGAGFRKNA